MNKPCIILYSAKPNRIKVIRALIENEYESYNKAKKKLLDFESIDDLFSLVNFNGENIISAHKKWLQAFNNRRSLMESLDLTSARMDINRVVLNFLTMVKTFTDHTETYLKRTYGDPSSKVNEFKAACSKEYDQSPSYRIMYQLRNYAQHCGLPVQQVAFNTSRKEGAAEIYDDKFQALCDRTHLLKTFEKWGRVKKDLEQQPEHFDIMVHVFEYMQSLFNIYEAVTKIDSELIDSAKFINNLLDGIDYEGFKPSIGWLNARRENSEELSYTLQDLPLIVTKHILSADKD